MKAVVHQQGVQEVLLECIHNCLAHQINSFQSVKLPATIQKQYTCNLQVPRYHCLLLRPASNFIVAISASYLASSTGSLGGICASSSQGVRISSLLVISVTTRVSSSFKSLLLTVYSHSSDSELSVGDSLGGPGSGFEVVHRVDSSRGGGNGGGSSSLSLLFSLSHGDVAFPSSDSKFIRGFPLFKNGKSSAGKPS